MQAKSTCDSYSLGEIYAHSTETPDKSDWEPLADHARAVARTARGHAEAFAPELAEIAGWLHDLGKMKPRFQLRLSNSDIIEPHAAEGARCVFERQPHLFSAILAQVILGHHAGLPDGGGNGRLLRARLEEAERLQPPDDWLVPKIATLPKALLGTHKNDPDRNYKLAFLGRMLFSALVDADRSETAAFKSGIHIPDRPHDLQMLRDRLDAHMARQDGDGPVNRLRGEVHAHARGMAAEAPGLFSLTVPTGGGKTLTALGFALDHAIRHGLKRVIFVIPYTSVVEQTAAVFRKVLDDPDGHLVLEHHSAFDWDRTRDDNERTDLKTAAERWDRPVIVTTAVQFLESLHAARTSPCRKLHRLAEAVVILDEAQTLPRHLLRPSLAAIRELARGYRSSLVLCTATQPALLKEDGFPHPEALRRDGPLPLRELAPDPERLYESLRRVRVAFAGPMDDVALAARLAEPAGGLVILNNRRHARALHERLGDLPGACHLSTNMTARHRRAVLADVRERLAERAPVRLVSTSLIEAGVDISFPRVFRALAGLDSIAQAAGRCNRNAELPGLGQVVVFEPGDTDAFAPPAELRQLAEVTRQVLLRHAEDPLSLEAVRDYFRQVFWNKAHAMDTGKVEGQPYEILEAIRHAGDEELNIPYASVAQAFRMIPEGAVPVVIRGGDWGLPEEEERDLSFVTSAGAIARRLQSYQVQVPERSRQKMLEAGVLRPLRPEDFGEQFLLLDQPGLYDARTGLKWDSFDDLGFLSF
ncbi:CRISPR-associated endonuclease Cas3'' [Sinirhodobacter populi]|uniref:CRISPR-associated endonuclease Cas3 n=2 Tax=Paenirhodobacter populi TaxID=2306993 RepID=A0A443J1C7_9RHOB|nr:CRISPR-associated endonuclease Cas3'' [Sinirhodobacter populi]RWR14219.1 CRISPR-associated endonuclease Cas3'' [Sinirhodobacter populi]